MGDDDPRNIYFDHPIDDSDMCIFSVVDFVLMDTALSYDKRNCPVSMMEDEDYGDDQDEDEETDGDNDDEDNESSSSSAAVVNASDGVSKFLFSFAALLLATMATF